MPDDLLSVPFEIGGHFTIQDISVAYVKGLLKEIPVVNPLFESVVYIDGKWLRISFNVSHEWCVDMPDEARQAIASSQFEVEE